MIKQNALTHEIREMLGFSPLQYMLDSICENPRLARIYTDSESRPTCCAVLYGHYLWLGGVVESNISYIASEINKLDLDILIVFYEDESVAALVKEQYSNVYENVRSLYRRFPEKSKGQAKERITPIVSSLFQTNIDNLEMITREVLDTATYENMDAFCSKGFGYAYVTGNKVCGFCTSEYQSKAAVAIGIEVLENYQRQGVATDMVNAFLHEAANRELIAYWDCWKPNEPSVKTALTCGFEKVIDYPVLIIDRLA